MHAHQVPALDVLFGCTVLMNGLGITDTGSQGMKLLCSLASSQLRGNKQCAQGKKSQGNSVALSTQLCPKVCCLYCSLWHFDYSEGFCSVGIMKQKPTP